jgi:hypothetical protein
MSNSYQWKFRLRPRKPPVPKNQRRQGLVEIAFKRITHLRAHEPQRWSTKSGTKMKRRSGPFQNGVRSESPIPQRDG